MDWGIAGVIVTILLSAGGIVWHERSQVSVLRAENRVAHEGIKQTIKESEKRLSAQIKDVNDKVDSVSKRVDRIVHGETDR